MKDTFAPDFGMLPNTKPSTPAAPPSKHQVELADTSGRWTDGLLANHIVSIGGTRR